jgi:hypothetical protein
MNDYSFTLLCVDRQDSSSYGGRLTEAARQQRGNGSIAAVAVAEVAASQQAMSSGVARRQDIGVGGSGRAVRRQHGNVSVCTRAAAAAQRRWQCGGSKAVLVAEQQRQSVGRAAE